MGTLTPDQFAALMEATPARVMERTDALVALLEESVAQAAAANILSRLTRRSGDLLSSIDTQVSRDGTLVRVVLTVGEEGGKAGAYAKVQDEGSGYLPGGVIRPRRARYLAIPMPIGRGPVGPQSPRDLPPAGTVWLPRRSGDGWVVIHNGQLLFVLVPEVRLKPRRYALDAADAVFGTEAVEQLELVAEVL